MNLASLADRLTAHVWTGAEVDAIVGDVRDAYVSHAADPEVRGGAASGGSVTAILLALLEADAIDGALVCVTSVEDGKVRARYRIARSRSEVLAARGSTYVLGDFAGEALGLIRGFEGRLAVVALPCQVALVRHDPALADKVTLTVALLCGHAMDTVFMDRIVDRLAASHGSGTLRSFRFLTGSWRGRLVAEFDDGTLLERPASHYKLYHNLYYGTPRQCMSCGDHFGYSADISAGDLWLQKYRNDPIKHTALIVKTDRGARALATARDAGMLEAVPVPIGEVLDGQRRTAPFHFNVTARSLAAPDVGMRISDRVRTSVRWQDRAVARMALRNHVASRDPEGVERVLARDRRLLKLRLYWMKGLESLPTGPLVPGAVPGTPRFSLIAATVYGNRGAEAMLETAIGRIRDRFPDARFTVFSYQPKADGELIRDAAVSVRSSTPAYLAGILFPLSLLAAPFERLTGRVPRIFPRSVRELGESVALVDLAGVSFIDGRDKYLPFNVLTVLPAMLLGTPVFKLSQAVGPFKHRLNRLLARWILARCAMVVPRGETTVQHLESISFPADRMHPAPDVAFGFEAGDSLSREGLEEAERLVARARHARVDGREVVGLCPSAVLASKARAEGWDYTGFVAQLAAGLVADGHSVLLFPNATRARSETSRNNDLPIIAAVAERLGARGGQVLHVCGDMNAAALRTVIEACSVVAVSRFHAMVGALAVGVPVAVVGWSHKYVEVMKQFGLEEFVFDYSEHDPEALRVVVERLLVERALHSAAILERLPAVRAESQSQFEELFRRIGR